jgi:hypothetical protein
MHKPEGDPSMTECSGTQLEFHGLGKRAVVARFDGGHISSDGGALLLREVEKRTRIMARMAEQFTDYRDPELIEHDVEALVSQRVLGLALGYEDLNDHDRLRFDALLALAAGKRDPSGQDRRHERDKGKALASSSTLNRLELTLAEVAADERYKKIVANTEGLDALLLELFFEAYDTPPNDIWIDLDATDDPVHGEQEGRFFHGYYDTYCYLPLYIFVDEHPLCARLRTADKDASAGSVEELARIVPAIRARWPETRIRIRGDSGFCREEIMAWCEAHGVGYVLGLAKNKRLDALSATSRLQAQQEYLRTEETARVFEEFQYSTLATWSRERRVIAKAEHSAGGANPRYVVTTLSAEEADPRTLYEEIYCARGDMENRIKEQQLDLFADRTSTHTMRANQLRLYMSTFAYVLLRTLRRLGLQGTDLADAQCGTIRTRLLKFGAQIRISVRRIRIALSESFPAQQIFEQALRNLRQVALRAAPA